MINHKNAAWITLAPQCVNVRLLVKQRVLNLEEMIDVLTMAGKFCTPSIAPDGSIKLGESALCPNCAHIDDSHADIITKIFNFDCTQCQIPIERLKATNPKAYALLTEVSQWKNF